MMTLQATIQYTNLYLVTSVYTSIYDTVYTYMTYIYICIHNVVLLVAVRWTPDDRTA